MQIINKNSNDAFDLKKKRKIMKWQKYIDLFMPFRICISIKLKSKDTHFKI
jgi:hypothetical protein